MSLRLLVPGTFGSNSSGKIARGTCENCIGIDWSRSEKRRRGQINKRGNLVLYVRPAAVFYFQFNIWNSADIEIGSVLVQIPRHCCELSSPETFNRVQKKKGKKREKKRRKRKMYHSLRISRRPFFVRRYHRNIKRGRGAARSFPRFITPAISSCLLNLQHLPVQLSKSSRPILTYDVRVPSSNY